MLLSCAPSPGQTASRRADAAPPCTASAGGPRTSRRSSPEDGTPRHFTPIAGINPMLVRRTAVLRLVQMVAGGSLGEAAAFLEIASADTTWAGKGRIYSGAGHVHTGAGQQPDPRGFEASLSASAGELDSPATPLVNYRRRRQALQAWVLDEETWTRLARRLPRVPGPEPELGTASARSRPSTSGSRSRQASTTSRPAPSRPPSRQRSRKPGGPGGPPSGT